MRHHRVPRTRVVAKQLQNIGFECMHEYFRKSHNKPKPEWADKSLFFAKSRILKMCHHSKKTKKYMLQRNCHECTDLHLLEIYGDIRNNHLGPTQVKVKLGSFRWHRSHTLNQLEWS